MSAWGCRVPPGGTGEAACVVNEEAARGRRVTLRDGQRAFYLHVDDGIVLGERGCSVPRRVDELMAADGLESVGFVVPDRRSDADVDKIVGYVVDRAPARLRLPERKAALLSKALYYASHGDVPRLGVRVWLHCGAPERGLLRSPPPREAAPADGPLQPLP